MIARCRVCGRALKDPRSVARLVGPVCRWHVGDTLDQRDLFDDNSALWSIVASTDAWLVIRDVGHDQGHKSVTTDAEHVVGILAPVLDDRRLFYFDSRGELDEIQHDAGRFVGFHAGAPAEVREVVT